MQEPMVFAGTEGETQVSLRDYIRVLYRGRWVILLSFLAVVGATAYFTFRATPIYEATATIMIDTERSPNVGLDFLAPLGMGTRETIINNQVEVLKSRTLAQAVLEELRRQGYDRTFYLFSDGKGRWSLRAKEVENPGDEVLIKRLQDRIKISPRRQTDFIDIKVQAPDPKEAMILANTIAEVYHRWSLEHSREEVRKVKEFLEEQLRKKEKDLVASELALKQYQEEHGVAELSAETEQLVEQLAGFEALYNEAKTKLGEARTRLRYLRSQYADQLRSLDEDMLHVTSPLLEELRDKLAELEATYARLISQNYRDDHPILANLRGQIGHIKEKMRQEIRALVQKGLSVSDPMGYSQALLERIYGLMVEVEADSSRARALGEVVRQYEERLKQVPEKSLQLARLKRAFEVNEKIYIMMKERLEETKITEAGRIGNVFLVDPAREPLYPVKPKKKLNLLLAAIVGLGMGLGVAFLMEYLDTSIHTVEEIEKQGFSVLAWVPRIQVAGRGGEYFMMSERLTSHLEPRSPVSESYRTLRTNLQYARASQALRSLVITSPSPKEGKSTTVANLAIVMAQAGMQVLLVDSDLRRPVLHHLFGQDKEPGLTEVVLGRASPEEVLRSTEVEGLTLLPCGTIPPNPAELLGSEGMHELVRQMGRRYDFVLLDAPPIIVVTDALLLSKEVDGTLLVVRAGQTDRNALLRARSLLDQVGVQAVGVVLNDIDVTGGYGKYYYPYYYYYYYYYREEGKRRRKRHKVA